MSDADLPEAGPPEAEVLAQLRRRLVSFARSRSSGDVAEDLTQETLLLLTSKYHHVRELHDLLPLSITILRYKILSHRRTSRRRGDSTAVPVEDLELRDPIADPLDAAMRRQAIDRLKEALPRLGARCREVFRLRLEGKSFAAIQSAMSAGSINTVYSWEFRCRRELRRILRGPLIPEAQS